MNSNTANRTNSRPKKIRSRFLRNQSQILTSPCEQWSRSFSGLICTVRNWNELDIAMKPGLSNKLTRSIDVRRCNRATIHSRYNSFGLRVNTVRVKIRPVSCEQVKPGEQIFVLFLVNVVLIIIGTDYYNRDRTWNDQRKILIVLKTLCRVFFPISGFERMYNKNIFRFLS